MRSVFTVLCFLAFSIGLHAASLPEWMIPLREAVYEQTLSINGFDSLYQAAKTAAKANCTGVALDLALSRCEYLMGRALQDGKQDAKARVHYEEGMRLAEKVLETAPGDEAWVLLAQNLSQNCSLGPWTYTVKRGLDVEKFAQNALSFNKRNASAQYLIAARWVYAPSPFHNYKKGLEMMQAIIEDGDMEKDNFFNVYVSVGYTYVQQKKFDEARPWLLRAQELYPSNTFVAELISQKK